MSDTEYELDPEIQKLEDSNQRAKEVVQHFGGEKEVSQVDEAFLIRYEEMRADAAMMEKTLKIMKDEILHARMPGERTLSMGRAAAFYKDIEAGVKIDYERLIEDLIGEVDAATLAKYTRPGREGYTQVTVRKL